MFVEIHWKSFVENHGKLLNLCSQLLSINSDFARQSSLLYVSYLSAFKIIRKSISTASNRIQSLIRQDKILLPVVSAQQRTLLKELCLSAVQFLRLAQKNIYASHYLNILRVSIFKKSIILQRPNLFICFTYIHTENKSTEEFRLLKVYGHL